jgi:hypothetical protein
VMYVMTMVRICRDPERSGYFVDSNRVSGYYDSHVMIFMTVVTVLFAILWTPFLVSTFIDRLHLLLIIWVFFYQFDRPIPT